MKATPRQALCKATQLMRCRAKVNRCKAGLLYLCYSCCMQCLSNPSKAAVKQCLGNQVLLSVMNNMSCLRKYVRLGLNLNVMFLKTDIQTSLPGLSS